MPETVLYEVAGGVATITLNRPERRNALSRELSRALADAVEAAAGDEAVRAAVLTGAGGAFCVGADLAGAPGTRALTGTSADGDRTRLVAGTRAAVLLHEMPKPVVAAIPGACAGAGLSLVLACDLRYAADTAVLNTAFVDAALPGDLGMAWFLTRAVGPARARELLLLPGRMGADAAAAAGLVHGVVPADGLAAHAAGIAGRLAAKAPLAVADAKRDLLDAQALPLGDYLRSEADRMVRCAHSADAREAAAAFLAKRPPRFEGR